MPNDLPIAPSVPNEKGEAISLAAQLDFRPEKFNNKVLFREEGLNLILFALLPSQSIPAHKTPNNAYLQCLEGEVTVAIGDVEYPLRQGEIILLPKGILHGIVALKETKLLLIKQQ